MDTEYRDLESVNFARTWSAELIGFYNGKMAAGQATIYPLWQINAGIQKKIWKGRGTIQLFARDIFHSNVSRMSVMTPTQHAFIKEADGPDGSRYFIDLSYKSWFGGERISPEA